MNPRPRRRPPLSARAQVPSLVRSLSRAGWGSLSGRRWQGVRSVLYGLSQRTADLSGTCESTAYQIAQAAGLSEKWTRRCLHVLEDLGVVQWHRGGVAEGRPLPSIFRIVKSRLVELVREARPEADQADRLRRVVTQKRLEKIRTGFAKSPARKHAGQTMRNSAGASAPTGEEPAVNSSRRQLTFAESMALREPEPQNEALDDAVAGLRGRAAAMALRSMLPA